MNGVAALAEQGSAAAVSDMAAEWATMNRREHGRRQPGHGGRRPYSQPGRDRSAARFLSSRAFGIGGGRYPRHRRFRALFSYERLPMLEIIFDRMVRLLSTSLPQSFFQDNVEVTLDNIRSVRFGDYLNSIPLPVQLAVFRAEAWENSRARDHRIESGLFHPGSAAGRQARQPG